MITAIVPSLNEEKNIAKVIKTIDKGLCKYFSTYKSVIVNADNNSSDKTVQIFRGVQTKIKKISIVSNEKGKGRNIYNALKLTLENGNFFLTLDADVKSTRIIWIKRFLQPVIDDNYDLIIPIYTRNRFEGNTTNHFSSPITFALFGINIPQPIAGDFAFSRGLATKLFNSFNIKSDFQYGVDTLLVTLAVLNKLKIKQIALGKKIHNPSFSKIYPTFTQGATSIFYLINKFRNLILKKKFEFYSNHTYNSSPITDDSYIKKPKEKQIIDMKKLSLSQIKRYESLYKKVLNKDILGKIKSEDYILNYSVWNKILFEYLKLLLTKKLNKKKIELVSQSLFPFYILRTITYFEEISTLKPKEIDMLFLKQKKELRCLVKKIKI